MTSTHPPFDSNRAWGNASAALRANREVVLALAGVFFLLPSLVIALLYPQPETVPGADQAAMMAQAEAYYRQTWPIALPLAALQAAGTLGLLTLLTDRARPTVGEAIKAGIGALLPYMASQIILGMGVGMLFLMIAGVAAGVGLPWLAVILAVVVGAPVMTRFALTAPVVAIERWRNPLAALRRAWQLSAGNTWRLLVFFGLILLAFVIIMSVVMGLTGIVLALLLPAPAVAMVKAVISSAIGAALVVLLVACLAATHAQLAGGGPDGTGTAFD